MAKIREWIKDIYHKILSINDSPQKKALGLGLGVFVGNFPGVGAVAALVCAHFLRVNKAMALIGSFSTNTWLSFLTLIFSIKLGSFLRGKDWHQVKSDWDNLIQSFQWRDVFHPTIIDMLCSILLGYFIISLIFGGIMYFVALIFFQNRARMIERRNLISKQ